MRPVGVFVPAVFGYASLMADAEPELDTEHVLEQGDALLRSSRALLAQLDRQLADDTASSTTVDEPGESAVYES